MFRIASSGKCVGRIGRDYVHLRHRDADFLRQALHNPVGSRQLLTRDRLGTIRSQCDLVAEEVRREIHDDGDDERQHHAALAANHLSYEQQEQCHRGEQ